MGTDIDPVSRTLAPLIALAAAATILLGLSGCGESRSAAAEGKVVHISERDFRIRAPSHVAPGAVDFQVHNRGPDAHELIVIRKRGALPLRSDGMTVDEEGLEAQTAGTLEPGQPGGVRDLSVTLAHGRYELLCNMSGHYRGGMHTDLIVG
jgi:uncharacterized cupredoxin-like copper-binding protein